MDVAAPSTAKLPARGTRSCPSQWGKVGKSITDAKSRGGSYLVTECSGTHPVLHRVGQAPSDARFDDGHGSSEHGRFRGQSKRRVEPEVGRGGARLRRSPVHAERDLCRGNLGGSRRGGEDDRPDWGCLPALRSTMPVRRVRIGMCMYACRQWSRVRSRPHPMRQTDPSPARGEGRSRHGT